MKLADLAAVMGASIATHPELAPEIEIAAIYAGNRMSDLLNHADRSTLVVTSLANHHLVRMAELLDAPGFCVAAAAACDPGLIEAAAERGLVLLLAPDPIEVLRGRAPAECPMEIGAGVG